MFVKVGLKDNGIYRLSDGELIATCFFPVAAPEFSDYEKDGKPVVLHYGYVNEDDELVPLCLLKKCNYMCLSRHHPTCRYTAKGAETQGFYVEIDEND